MLTLTVEVVQDLLSVRDVVVHDEEEECVECRLQLDLHIYHIVHVFSALRLARSAVGQLVRKKGGGGDYYHILIELDEFLDGVFERVVDDVQSVVVEQHFDEGWIFHEPSLGRVL